MARAGRRHSPCRKGTVWARAARGGGSLTIDTPAAAAAIRGTDWSLTVNGDRTALIVMEGTVELANPQGSVTVRQGEAAVADSRPEADQDHPGPPQGPRADAVLSVAARRLHLAAGLAPRQSRAMRTVRSRIADVPPTRRSAEDWLTLAETSLSFDGRQAASDALAKARGMGLSARQRARADLVDALIAGAQKRWPEAASLFRRAQPRLEGARRTTAQLWQRFSRRRSPTRQRRRRFRRRRPPPTVRSARSARPGSPASSRIPKAALAVVRAAGKRFPDSALLASAEAQLALLTDDRDIARAAAARGLAIDPDDPWAIQADAYVRAYNDEPARRGAWQG